VTAIVGAGLAGLVAARSLVQAGREVVVLEGAAAPGGTTLLSSGQLWRYRSRGYARWGAPAADQELLAAIGDGLEEAARWLRGECPAGVHAGAGSSTRTEGVRIDCDRVVEVLAGGLPEDALALGWRVVAADRLEDGRVRLRSEDGVEVDADAVVFAGGGWAGNLARVATHAGLGPAAHAGWLRRNAGTSTGASTDAAVTLGVHATADGGCFARLMPRLPAGGLPTDWVRTAQVYGRSAVLLDSNGEVVPHAEHDWADTLLAWELARRGGRGQLRVAADQLADATPYGSVAEVVERAERAGCELERRADGGVGVPVQVGITHTLGGLRSRPDARLVDATGTPLPGLFGAGVDVGGVATGGYASGLAQALVLGRLAAQQILARDPDPTDSKI
jgi:succinate dehydrogenase/fumarate reductase flavoprotein subunit